MSINVLLILMNTIGKRTLMLKMTMSQTSTRQDNNQGVSVQVIFSLDHIMEKHPLKLWKTQVNQMLHLPVFTSNLQHI